MATIIRHNADGEQLSGTMVQPISFSFAEFRDQADHYLDAVRQEAAKIVQNAHHEANQIRRQAEIAGRKAAEHAIEQLLEEKVAKRVETLLPTLERLVAEINNAKGELLGEWERGSIHVAVAIAERIIRREIARQPEITLDLVADALRVASGSSEITLHVNPSDYEQLRPQLEQIANSVCKLAPTEIVANGDISRGGCRVETRYGSIDEQIEAQLQRVEQELS